MIPKFGLGDTIQTDNFVGVVSMITISKKGIRYRAYGEYTYESGMILTHTQHDIWETEINDMKESE